MDFKTEATQKIIDYKLGKIGKKEFIKFCEKLLELKAEECGNWENAIFTLSKKQTLKQFKLDQTWVEIELKEQENNLLYYALTIVSDNEILTLGIPL